MLQSQEQLNIIENCLIKIKNKELVTKQDLSGFLVPNSEEHYIKYKEFNQENRVFVNAVKDIYYAGAFALDFSLNSIALNNWDKTQVIKGAKTGFSASDIICAAKHKVIYNILDISPVFMAWRDQVEYNKAFEDMRKKYFNKGYFGGQDNMAIELIGCK